MLIQTIGNVIVLDNNLLKAAFSELPSESEDMEYDYFDEDPSDGAGSTITDMVNVMVEKVQENSKVCKNQTTNRKVKPPKPIMVREINDITELTALIKSDCDPNFEVKILGRWVKINTQTFTVEEIIVNFLEHKFQSYVTTDLKAPMKVVIRGLPKSIKIENIERELMKNGFDVIKTVQMISRKDDRVLPLFLLHLPKASSKK